MGFVHADGQCRVRQTTGVDLGRDGIEIASLIETWFAEVGEIKEVGAGDTFI